MTLHARWAMIFVLWLLAGLAQAGTKHYYYTDPQGTVLAKADAQGNIVATYDYAPYGAQVLGAPPNGPTGYTGHVNDAETGFVYMQARYYDPLAGRFLSVDPVGPNPGNPYNFNPYAYANNNPVGNIDRDGRQSTMTAGTWTGEAVMAEQSPQQVQRLNEVNTAQAKLTSEAIVSVAGGEARGVVKSIIAIYKVLSNSSPTPKLTGEQSNNLARFEKKFSKENRNVQVSHGEGGTITMKNDVPGKVPGSKAVYEKTVDSSGKTISATKTTYDPEGKVVHVKDKLTQ